MVFYDMHMPGFRKYIVDIIMDVVKNYDIDGVNLDYIRTGGYCTSSFCQQDYQSKYGRDLLADLALSPIPQEVRQWVAAAVEAIVQDVHDRVKAIKPHVIISVDGHINEEFDENFNQRPYFVWS